MEKEITEALMGNIDGLIIQKCIDGSDETYFVSIKNVPDYIEVSKEQFQTIANRELKKERKELKQRIKELKKRVKEINQSLNLLTA